MILSTQIDFLTPKTPKLTYYTIPILKIKKVSTVYIKLYLELGHFVIFCVYSRISLARNKSSSAMWCNGRAGDAAATGRRLRAGQSRPR